MTEIDSKMTVGASEVADFRILSKLGLVYRINTEILHPLGLALSYTPEDGMSVGAIISDDGEWTYSETARVRGIKARNDFDELLKSKTIQKIVDDMYEARNSD